MEPRFNFFNQICITSGNVRAISDLFTDVYGLGPWLYVTFGDDGTHNFISVDDVVLGGVPRSSYSLINGTCRIGNMEYELLQPAGGVSVNSEFLEKRDGRPGLQHFCLDDGAAFDPIRRSLDALGLDREQIACIDHIETCVMRDLKSIIGSDIELHRRDADFTGRYRMKYPPFIVEPVYADDFVHGYAGDDEAWKRFLKTNPGIRRNRL